MIQTLHDPRDPIAISRRFPIRFDPAYALLSRALFIAPGESYVAVVGGHVSVRMSWAFRATFDRSRVTGASRVDERVSLTRGVHGWNGRWLVNGSGDGLVAIDLEPRQRAYVMGFPVTLRRLEVSVDDPDRLIAAFAG